MASVPIALLCVCVICLSAVCMSLSIRLRAIEKACRLAAQGLEDPAHG